jgi:hypothetical protein
MQCDAIKHYGISNQVNYLNAIISVILEYLDNESSIESESENPMPMPACAALTTPTDCPHSNLRRRIDFSISLATSSNTRPSTG